jgi:hypothetical protein
MKKSVMLMAGFMAMALAGSAQAATMFAVQNSGAVDQATISDIGTINTNGHITTNNPSAAGGWIGIGTATPAAPFHVNVTGTTSTNAGFIYQFTNTRTSPAPQAFTAPNFTFLRNNDATINGGLPRVDDTLGVLNFGTVVSGVRTTTVVITAKSEAAATTTSQPSYLAFNTADAAGVSAERVRITSSGNVGIGAVPSSASPSKLTVAALPTYADNATALGAIGAGGFYRCGDQVCVAH